MKFNVFNRFRGEVQFTAEIDVKENEVTSVKLGLAVKWAVENGASLDGASFVGARLDGASLDGASFVGASLDGASLDGASLDGARLDGASLDGAILDGASQRKIKRLIARTYRVNDPYEFFLYETTDGALVYAGCRSGLTLNEYRAHVAKEYPETEKGDETLAILDFFEKRSQS